MPRSMRRNWRICRLLFVPFFLFAPALEVLDGDAEDVQLGAPETVVASSEKHVLLETAPGDATPPVLTRPPSHTPPPPFPTWRPPRTPPVRSRPARRDRADPADAAPS